MANRNEDKLMELPDVESVNPEDRTELEAALAQYAVCKEYEQRGKKLKDRIAEIVMSQGLASEDGVFGVRNRRYAVVVSSREGKKQLSREKLLGAGVTTTQINSSYTQGDPYIMVEFQEFS